MTVEEIKQLWSASFPNRETPSEAQIARWTRTFTAQQIRRGINRAARKFSNDPEKSLLDIIRYADSVAQHELYQTNPEHETVRDERRLERTKVMNQEWVAHGLPDIHENWLIRWADDEPRIITLAMERTKSKLRYARPPMSTNDAQKYFASVVRNQVRGITEVPENSKWSAIRSAAVKP